MKAFLLTQRFAALALTAALTVCTVAEVVKREKNYVPVQITESTTLSAETIQEETTEEETTEEETTVPVEATNNEQNSAKQNRSSKRQAKTKQELLALDGLTWDDLNYYEEKGMGSSGIYYDENNFDGVLDEYGARDIQSFCFQSEDPTVGHVFEIYYLRNGRLSYVTTETELDNILERDNLTKDEFYQQVEDVKHYTCEYCGKHDCPVLNYRSMSTGLIYDVAPCGGPGFCSAVLEEKIKCPHCGKILMYSEDERINDHEHYCSGGCHLSFGYSGNED